MKAILLLFVEEASRFFVKEKTKTEHMNLKLFLTGDKFELVIDLRSMADRTMHGSGVRLVNTIDGVQLKLVRHGKGSGKLNCQIFVISDSQFSLTDNQLELVQF